MNSSWQPYVLLLVFAGTAAAEEGRLGPAPHAPEPQIQQKFAPLPQVSQGAGGWLDTSNREAIRASYLNTFVPAGAVPMGWTGSIASGNAGNTSAAYKQAVITAVNWFRAMAGVPPTVTLNTVNSAKAQQAAFMFSANRNLSHSPPSSWIFYTADAAEAAGNSNICYNSSGAAFLPGCVNQYMRDDGSNNYPVGHRRWILYPQTQMMGTGDVERTPASPSSYPYANALWVFDGNYGAARPGTRNEFVAWPPPGFVPYQMIYPRWSFSYPGASFSGATVTMFDGNGAAIPLTTAPIANGYGENTIVWTPVNPLPAGALQQDTPIDVMVSGFIAGGQSRSFSYRVTVFDPSVVGPAVRPDRVGVYSGGRWILDRDGDGSFTGGVDRDFFLGFAGATPVRGDWNGDGVEDVGVYASGYWFLDYDGNGAWDGGVLDKLFAFGWAGAMPIVGDWNGDGRDSAGVYANGFWFLDYNGDRSWDGGVGDKLFGLGWPGVEPLIGDWNGDGRDKIGVFAHGFWFLDYDGSYSWDGGVADRVFAFGWSGVKPVVGDWNGDGRDSAGVYLNGAWFLDYDGNGQWNPVTGDRSLGLGGPEWAPLAGDWNGDGRESVGVFWNGYWLLDFDASGDWNGLLDRAFSWGPSGSVPFAGSW
jgi:uncharacterized protein YkwD